MAKDARGHGSEGGRGGVSRPVGSGLQFGVASKFKSKGGAGMKSDRDHTSDAARTVSDLRSRMATTGAGHKTGLMQGIKNFLGGR